MDLILEHGKQTQQWFGFGGMQLILLLQKNAGKLSKNWGVDTHQTQSLSFSRFWSVIRVFTELPSMFYHLDGIQQLHITIERHVIFFQYYHNLNAIQTMSQLHHVKPASAKGNMTFMLKMVCIVSKSKQFSVVGPHNPHTHIHTFGYVTICSPETHHNLLQFGWSHMYGSPKSKHAPVNNANVWLKTQQINLTLNTQSAACHHQRVWCGRTT